MLGVGAAVTVGVEPARSQVTAPQGAGGWLTRDPEKVSCPGVLFPGCLSAMAWLSRDPRLWPHPAFGLVLGPAWRVDPSRVCRGHTLSAREWGAGQSSERPSSPGSWWAVTVPAVRPAGTLALGTCSAVGSGLAAVRSLAAEGLAVSSSLGWGAVPCSVVRGALGPWAAGSFWHQSPRCFCLMDVSVLFFEDGRLS